ncbi:MAG: hypothetical protein NT022_10365 [Deltaproteobacteria bacterium]|nr:hypothetical protein [Deltaproteobacteria bacterium]
MAVKVLYINVASGTGDVSVDLRGKLYLKKVIIVTGQTVRSLSPCGRA